MVQGTKQYTKIMEHRSETNLEMNRDNRDEQSAPGNTESGARKQGIQCKYYVFTLNNYEDRDIETIEIILRDECTWYIFQEEVGEQGTPHLQGTLCLRERQRITQLKRLDPRIHWEPTKSVKASIAYASKEETRAGKQFVYGIEIPQLVKVYEPRGWQLAVMDIIKTEPDDRTIHWFYEEHGNVGKSSLAKYLVVRHNANIVDGDKKSIAQACVKTKHREIFIVDIPRISRGYVSYGAIEALKNGLIFSGRYETAQVVFNCPHVICFANFYPDVSVMSLDRWNIVHIQS